MLCAILFFGVAGAGVRRRVLFSSSKRRANCDRQRTFDSNVFVFFDMLGSAASCVADSPLVCSITMVPTVCSRCTRGFFFAFRWRVARRSNVCVADGGDDATLMYDCLICPLCACM